MYSSAQIVYDGDGNYNVTLAELNDRVYYRLHIPAVIFVSLCIVLGVVGNILVITIYKTRFRRSNHRYFILFLGVADLLACLTGMPFLLASLRFPYMMTSSIACKVLRCLHYSVNNSSGLLLVVIAIERYQKICKPFKKQLSHNQTLYLCFGTVLFSCLVAIPAAVFYGDSTIDTGVANITGTQCYVAAPYKGKGYFELYQALLLVETFTSIIIFGVLYVFIIRKLWASDQFIQTMRTVQKTLSRAEKNYKPNSAGDTNSMEDSMDSKFDSMCGSESDNHNVNVNNRGASLKVSKSEPESFTQPIQSQSRSYSIPVAITTKLTALPVLINHKQGKQNTEYKESHENANKKSDTKTTHAVKNDDKHGQQNNGITVDTEDNHQDTGGPHKPNNVNSLSPIQKQVYEQILAKQTLERGAKRATETRRSAKTTARVTVMLFTVTLVFVLAFVPHLTLMLITIEVVNFLNNMSETELMVYHVFLRIFIINNVANPIVYFIFDVKFRKLCKAVFKNCCKKKEQWV